jgi:hypothetical protein
MKQLNEIIELGLVFKDTGVPLEKQILHGMSG